jgi:hypothetical protein
MKMLKNQKQPGVKMIELFLFKVLTPQPIIIEQKEK